jgi:hypothetical protein
MGCIMFSYLNILLTITPAMYETPTGARGVPKLIRLVNTPIFWALVIAQAFCHATPKAAVFVLFCNVLWCCVTEQHVIDCKGGDKTNCQADD